jgi:hypothetical protein
VLNKLAFVAVMGLLTITVASPSQAQDFSEQLELGTVYINKTVDAGLFVYPAQAKKALTWTSKHAPVVSGGKTYIFVGTDYISNGYIGDTNVTEARSLLCIRKSPDLTINPIPSYAYTIISPGGASTNTWSGGQVFAIPNVVGTSLVSQAYADNLCQTEGLRAYNLSGFRMAEFHDGTGAWPGWNFWAQAASQFNGLSPHPADNLTPIANMRYWVRINDQNANPW